MINVVLSQNGLCKTRVICIEVARILYNIAVSVLAPLGGHSNLGEVPLGKTVAADQCIFRTMHSPLADMLTSPSFLLLLLI